MRSTVGLLIILFTTLAFGLKPNGTKTVTEEHRIEGVWVAGTYEESTVTYTRSRKREMIDGPSIEFKEEGVLVVVQNAGWCGTPPISYGNFDGTWLTNQEGHYELSYAYWGGTVTELWDVKQISKNKLEVEILDYQTIESSGDF